MESGEGVSEGAEVAAGARVLVGTGSAVAAGSTGSEEEQAQDTVARATTQRKRAIRARVECRGRVIMARRPGSDAPA